VSARHSGALSVLRDLLNGHWTAALSAAGDTMVFALGVTAMALVLVAVKLFRRRTRLPVAVLVSVLVGALLVGGTWKTRSVVRDVKEDRSEAIANVLDHKDTVVPNGPAGSADIWAVGDGADGKPIARDVVRLMAATKPDRLLQLGDVYGPYAKLMDQAYGGLADRIAATPGNHDWHKPARIREYLDYWENKPQGRALYYEFDIAGWQILSLNSEIPLEPTSAQMTWLNGQLSGPGDCRIAFSHRPRYSAGRHGDQQDMDVVWNAMRGHVALVLAGHDHDMQRFKPTDGITEMVIGSGGHSHYVVHDDAQLAFGDDTHNGALHLQLSPGLAKYAFTAVDGTVLDSGQLTCSSS
jgi:hypothetical protein